MMESRPGAAIKKPAAQLMTLALATLLLPLLEATDVPAKPHIFFLLVDDYGWAGAGWHNDVQSGGRREVQTPNMDAMVKEGIELNQHYTFKFCSPTRSSLQSGRNPIHVNVQNVDPTRSNPADPVAGFSAIARNMTGMAVHMQAAGWATAAVGKWDAGMATPDHTPEGRGYQQSLIYFHHANDYWQYTCGSCRQDGPYHEVVSSATYPLPKYTEQEAQELNLPPTQVPERGTCPAKFTIKPGYGICKDSADVLWHGPVQDQDACCAKCASFPSCVGWTHQFKDPEGGNTSVCFTCNGTTGGPTPGRNSGCVGPACNLNSNAVTDLWSGSAPALSMKPPASCVAQNGTDPWPINASCLYEDALFESEVRRIVAQHPLPKPLFLFWAPHIVHGPAQLPKAAFDALDFIGASNGPESRNRQNYLGRVHYIDAAFGRFVTQLKTRGMWENSVVAMSADNGGPLGSANNYPQKGGKHSNWQGGVRVNAFLSGGALPAAVRGTVSNELITIWDWYATFVEGIAGMDPTDHRAAAAGLPPIDSVNHWDFLVGKVATSPRAEIPLGSCTAAPDQDAFCQSEGHQQTIVNAVVTYVGDGADRQLWKLLIGRVPLAGWTGPKYPNGTGAETPTVSCGMPPEGSGCLYNLSDDPTEHNNLADVAAHNTIKMHLFAKIQQHNATAFSPDRGPVDPAACTAARQKFGGFWGPWIK
jgi:arylsulfatase A-like enzyme